MSSGIKKALSRLKQRKNKQTETSYYEETQIQDEKDEKEENPKRSSISNRVLVEGIVSHPSMSEHKEERKMAVNSDSIDKDNIVIATDLDDETDVFVSEVDNSTRHRKKYDTELIDELRKIKEKHKTLNEQLKSDFDAVKSKNIVLASENETLKDKLFLFYICMVIITVLQSLLVACFALR